MHFEIIGLITEIETSAVGRGIRDLARLKKQFGKGHWRNLKGTVTVRLKNGKLHPAELHWDEAHGIGRKKIKIKRYLD